MTRPAIKFPIIIKGLSHPTMAKKILPKKNTPTAGKTPLLPPLTTNKAQRPKIKNSEIKLFVESSSPKSWSLLASIPAQILGFVHLPLRHIPEMQSPSISQFSRPPFLEQIPYSQFPVAQSESSSQGTPVDKLPTT